jgi:hypothetical protein
MGRLTDEQEAFLLAELKEIELLAKSLKKQVGNETTLELHERIREIKKHLAIPEWT